MVIAIMISRAMSADCSLFEFWILIINNHTHYEYTR